MVENDKFPTKLCSDCVFQLKLSYKFKEQCIRSQIQLSEIKIEKNKDDILLIGVVKNLQDEKGEQNILLNVDINNVLMETSSKELDVIYELNVPDETESLELGKNENDGNESDNYVVEVLEEDIDYETDDKNYVKTSNGYECKECQRTYKHEALCQNHVLKHQKIKKCLVCDKKFNCKNSF